MADKTATLTTFEVTIQALGRQQIIRYLQGSSKSEYHLCFSILHTTVFNTTLLVYDIIINLQLEVEHIWTRKWSFFTVLYILQRYLPLFDEAGATLYYDFGANLSIHNCALYYKIAGASSAVGIGLSEVVLTFRVWAVWEGSFPVAIGLVVFFLACWVPAVLVLAQFMNSVEFVPLTFPNFRGCSSIAGRNHIPIYLVWVLWIVYDAGAFVMILIPGVAAYRRGGRSELVKTIYQDGVVYYALVFLTSMFNVVVTLTLPPDCILILAEFERVLHSVLTSHAILHIRRVYLQQSTPQTMSQIQFGRNEHISSFHTTEPPNTNAESLPNPVDIET
ncbi:hypothetical protein E1B28_001893 [Marasmius oreades]|uniref:DUF6533 domain-containing protein n=1 Tax=Marasmius oreades TaxID=181124 RepID=A0A9P7V4I1_9AGAR|nr:uncharacterized protein E1B28_001893 [Marasmius oreades]KAG7100113.1 hypothetical protein E1B28_001893 [Marasmius oreades]